MIEPCALLVWIALAMLFRTAAVLFGVGLFLWIVWLVWRLAVVAPIR